MSRPMNTALPHAPFTRSSIMDAHSTKPMKAALVHKPRDSMDRRTPRVAFDAWYSRIRPNRIFLTSGVLAGLYHRIRDR